MGLWKNRSCLGSIVKLLSIPFGKARATVIMPWNLRALAKEPLQWMPSFMKFVFLPGATRA